MAHETRCAMETCIKTAITPGKIILLNGASSAGKSTLAREVRRQIAEPFWHVASDQFVEADMLPARTNDGSAFDWRVMRPRFFEAFHRCLPAIASSGNNLIIDHVIEFPSWMDDLVALLSPFDVFFVGVHCPLKELERRERERGDRTIGEGRDHLEVVHTLGPYDWEVDTSVQPVEGAAEDLIRAWIQRTHPCAFERMATTNKLNK